MLQMWVWAGCERGNACPKRVEEAEGRKGRQQQAGRCAQPGLKCGGEEESLWQAAEAG
jgi:hypothetical protein